MTMAAAVAFSARAAVRQPSPTVRCDEIILRVAGKEGAADKRRLLLGRVLVPEPYLAQIERTYRQPWRYFRKAGMVIRGGLKAPVSVRVPRLWRSRVAIRWGNAGAPVSSLRFEPCAAFGANKWNAYSGGFYLQSPSACVPLIFRVGRHSASARFGLGVRCAPTP